MAVSVIQADVFPSNYYKNYDKNYQNYTNNQNNQNYQNNQNNEESHGNYGIYGSIPDPRPSSFGPFGGGDETDPARFMVCVSPGLWLSFGWADPEKSKEILITVGTPPHNINSPRVTINILKLNEVTYLPLEEEEEDENGMKKGKYGKNGKKVKRGFTAPLSNFFLGKSKKKENNDKMERILKNQGGSTSVISGGVSTGKKNVQVGDNEGVRIETVVERRVSINMKRRDSEHEREKGEQNEREKEIEKEREKAANREGEKEEEKKKEAESEVGDDEKYAYDDNDSDSEKNDESDNESVKERDNERDNEKREGRDMREKGQSKGIYIAVQQLGSGRVVRIVRDLKDFDQMNVLSTNASNSKRVSTYV